MIDNLITKPTIGTHVRKSGTLSEGVIAEPTPRTYFDLVPTSGMTAPVAVHWIKPPRCRGSLDTWEYPENLEVLTNNEIEGIARIWNQLNKEERNHFD